MKPDDLLPSAKEFALKVAMAQAEEASRLMKLKQESEAEKRALLDVYKKPSGVSDEERIRRALTIIERGVSNGLTEVQFYRFPNELCTDRGRAINQAEPGWPETLTGVPKEIYQTWNKYFREKGYKLKVEIVDYPNGIPGDIGMSLKWD
jgi:hypothetical protein